MRITFSGIPRIAFACLVFVCAAFAVAALWTTIPGAAAHLFAHGKDLVEDRQLSQALLNTGILFALSVGMQLFICGLGSTVVTSARPIALALLLIPYATGVLAPAFAFFVLISTGVGPLDFSLANSAWSQRFIVALIDTWEWIGILLVAMFLQLNRIPRSYFQLADLEGIGWWKRWRLIVWPQLRIVFAMYTTFRLLDWLRKVDFARAIFDRGAGGSLETIAMYIQRVHLQSAPSLDANTTQFQDTYSNFLVLLQVLVLMSAAVYLSSSRVAGRFFETGRLGEPDLGEKLVQPLWRRISVAISWCLLAIFIISPLIWIAVLSVQNVDLSGNSGLRFHFVPNHPTLEAYRSILSGNKDIANGNASGILNALLYSLKWCSLAALLACLVAICTAFLFLADLRAARLKGPLLGFVFSIFLFPPAVVGTALNTLATWMPSIATPAAQLLFVYTSTSFVLSFVLVLIRCMAIPLSYFEQALLERRSRVLAFYDAYIREEWGMLLFVFVLAFSACWSEFYISDLITVSQETKPFAVVLAMNHTQYNAFYSLFAAGAVLSLACCIAAPVLTIAFVAAVRSIRKRRSDRLSQPQIPSKHLLPHNLR